MEPPISQPAFWDALPVALLVLGSEKPERVLWANGRFEKLFGYSRAQLVGQPLPAAFADGQAKVELQGSPEAEIVQRRHLGGQAIDVAICTARLDNWGETASAQLCCYVPVARRAGGQAGLRTLIAELQHEVNNSLQPIVGYADLLAKDPQIGQRPELQEILQRALQLRKLFLNLRALGREEAALDAETIRRVLKK